MLSHPNGSPPGTIPSGGERESAAILEVGLRKCAGWGKKILNEVPDMSKSELTFLDSTIQVTPFWEPLLTHCFIEDIRAIEGDLKKLDILPEAALVLRFLQTKRVSGVVLGQDPYSTPGKATGRAFEVGGLDSWRNCSSDSLLEILKALYRFSRGKQGRLKKKDIIADAEFVVLPPSKLFEHWESEGVLLLNTALTCAPKRAGSHLALWAPIVNKVIRFLCAQPTPPFWFLWGEEAQAYELLLPEQVIYREVHPNLQGKKPGAFFSDTATCFSKVADVDWCGRKLVARANIKHERSDEKEKESHEEANRQKA